MSNYLLEAHCLGVLLRRPNLLYQVDRKLQEDGLKRLSPDEFQHADHQAIVYLFQQSVDQDVTEPLDFVFNNLSLPMMELADNLLAQTAELDPNDERVLEDLMRGLLDLRNRNLHQDIEYQRYLIEDAQEKGNLKITQFGQTMVQLTEAKRRIDKALEKYIGRSTSLRQ
jgi:hypothetical protein